MDARLLRYFLAIVESGSLTKAAEVLHVAQPSLSRAVQSLERSVGATLFSRVRHGMTLTPAGAALVEPARAVERALALCGESVTAALGTLRGSLEVACLGSLAIDPLARLVGELRRRHPGITLCLRDPGRAALVLELVADARCAVGLVDLTGSIDTGGVDEHLVVHELARHEFMLVEPPGARGTEKQVQPVPLAVAAKGPLIMTPTGTSTRDLVDAAIGAPGVAPNVVVESEHRETVVELVLAGVGATFLPSPLARQAAARGAVVRPTEPRVTRSTAIVHRTELLTPTAAAFLDVAVNGMPGAASSYAPDA